VTELTRPAVELAVRKSTRRLVVLLGMLALLVAVGMFSLYRMSQWQPSFYDQSLRMERAKAVQAGDELEQNLLAVHNEVADDHSWQIAILDEQVNGWLATVLPEKFPDMLPDGVENPRVEFRSGQAELACRYQGPRFSAVASVVVEPFLSEQPNVIALRIRKARVGALPGLKKKLVEQCSIEARRLGIPLQWTQLDSDPVALVTFDASETSDLANLHLEVLDVSDGQLVIAGRGSQPIKQLPEQNANAE
jgi:hypothetical protein